jgi:iron complex transport system permease protein
VRWSYLTLPAIGFVVATAYLALNGRQLNALVMGDETARTLGVDVDGLRRRVFVVASLLTGLVVAVSGAVGFVGLMLPHVTRMFVGADHRRVLPIAALLGAVFMVWVDVAARTLVAPEELPLGVITALLGVPFFVWLLRRKAF